MNRKKRRKKRLLHTDRAAEVALELTIQQEKFYAMEDNYTEEMEYKGKCEAILKEVQEHRDQAFIQLCNYEAEFRHVSQYRKELRWMKRKEEEKMSGYPPSKRKWPMSNHP